MNYDFRLATTFLTHPKIEKLRRRLGAEGVLGWIGLLAHTAAYRPSGNLEGLDNDDIAIAVKYPGDIDEFVEALVELRLLDRKGPSLTVHDWTTWNNYAATHQQRSEQARKAVMT